MGGFKIPIITHEKGIATEGAGLQVCVLASGSSGNAIYVSDGESRLLVDAGLSGVEIQRRMAERGLDPAELTAIVVTHEHDDHIRGAGVLCRRFGLPVYTSRATGAAAAGRVKTVADHRYFEAGAAFTVGALSLRPFSTSHDAADPAGLVISGAGEKLGIATDLGVATAVVRTHLKGCGLLILEANHDPEMLMSGPYPWPLKQRVRGRAGHLSNEDCRDLIGELTHDGLRHVILAHLSEQNNTPEKAVRAVTPALGEGRTILSVAEQHRCGRIYRVTRQAAE